MKLLRLAALAALTLCAALAQTTVADTVSLSPGVTWTGTVTISWPAFTASDGRAIAAGQTQAKVTNGALSVSLWPSVGATWPAAGLSAAGPYTAVYNTTAGPDRGHTWQEIWNVPATSPASLADVRKASSLSGNTIYSGTTVPADALGMRGDFYLRNPGTTPCMYGPKPGAAWSGTCVTLTGPTGAPGIMQSGAAPPSNSVGSDGQFYIDNAKCMWGPKASGAWPGSCTSLIGPPGPVSSVAGRTGAIVLTQSDVANLVSDLGLKSPAASPVFSGQATIPDFTLAAHSHQNAAGGGTLNASAISAGVFGVARLPTGLTNTTVARGDQTLYALAAPKADGYWCVQTVSGVPTLVAVSSGLCGTGGGGGGGLSWAAVTNSQWTALTNSQWTSLGN